AWVTEAEGGACRAQRLGSLRRRVGLAVRSGFVTEVWRCWELRVCCDMVTECLADLERGSRVGLAGSAPPASSQLRGGGAGHHRTVTQASCEAVGQSACDFCARSLKKAVEGGPAVCRHGLSRYEAERQVAEAEVRLTVRRPSAGGRSGLKEPPDGRRALPRGSRGQELDHQGVKELNQALLQEMAQGGVRIPHEELRRYFYYLEQDLGEGTLEDFPKARVVAAVGRLSRELKFGPFGGLLAGMERELRCEYHRNLKKAILGYLLQSSSEVQRLSLPTVAQVLSDRREWFMRMLYEAQPPDCRAPVVWHEACREAQAAHEQGLWCMDWRSLQLGFLWTDGFDTMQLLDVTTNKFTSALPMSLDGFVAYQRTSLKAALERLWTEWVPAVAGALAMADSELAPAGGYGGEPAEDTEMLEEEGEEAERRPWGARVATPETFRSLSALVNVQLRTLQLDSVGAFHKFLTHRIVPADHALDPHGAQHMWPVPPTLTITAGISELSGQLDLRPDFKTFHLTLYRTLEECLTAMRGLPLPGWASQADLEALVAGTYPDVPFGSCIPAVSREERPVEECLNELEAAMERGEEKCMELLALYRPFLTLYTIEPIPYIEELAETAGDDIRVYAAEKVRLQEVIAAIEESSTEEVRVGMFLVSMRRVREILVECGHALLKQVTGRMISLTMEMAQEIHVTFDGVAQTVAQVPANEEELVAQRQYIQQALDRVTQLEKQVHALRKRDECLFEFRTGLSDTDVQLLYMTYSWPQKIRPLIATSSSRNNEQKREFEVALKKRRKALEELCVTEARRPRRPSVLSQPQPCLPTA
ncbi:hypothetical protein CYMTET_4768, partial [Cymbomonas tetramitiformis]